MWKPHLTKKQLAVVIGTTLGAFVTLAFLYLQNDIHKNYLDPKIPFQVYQPPEAPDYTGVAGWYLNPALAGYTADPRKVDVFFIHATTFDGGKGWLAPVNSNAIANDVQTVQLPNYAAPFSITGNIYAPKYRQASLFSQLTLRDDAREARQYPYRDIEAAFRQFIKSRRGGRGFVIVGVEQGGLLAERLLRDIVAPDPELKSQLVAAYLLETFVPEQMLAGDAAPLPACRDRQQTGCAVAYASIDAGRPDMALQVLQKSVYWNGDAVTATGSRKAVCVNPLSGGTTTDPAESKQSLGATNATGLEWGTTPALIMRKVSARCLGGLLFVNKPNSPSFEDGGSWEDKRKVNPYNLFYGDLQEDIRARWLAFHAAQPG